MNNDISATVMVLLFVLNAVVVIMCDTPSKNPFIFQCDLKQFKQFLTHIDDLQPSCCHLILEGLIIET